ncbi:MAG: glutamine synthetase III [Lachnospiraceae bacterium]|nr:glutamine synthetase III [Lachnospiraceae bacterium]
MFTDEFGSNVFNDSVMKKYLMPDTFAKLENIRNEGAPMEQAIAEEIAQAMMKWAIDKGATHYTHWFQPMTGITAEKHDSFLSMDHEFKPILEFSSKALIKGEADASSFPSGGMRATFEGRGYTVWDPTSDAFIKDGTLCIPTAFCSYTGAVLDKKTPLLRSMVVLNRQAKRVLKLLGEEVKYVYPTVGCEQEYFLVNKSDYAKREDLVLTGRTLFGSLTPKGQLLGTHYYGSIRSRVKAFMAELDEELWKLGIYSKTEHNEAAPCQHEMACIFNKANVAADQNQLVMEVMRTVANRHDFVCILHEKPFAGINGSGKHNNWAIASDTGENLLKPGKEPENNIRFLMFMTAVIKAVDDYQDLLRISSATASNDYRLGGNEAPPAILSVFLGTDLEELVKSIIDGTSIKKSKTEYSYLADNLPGLMQDKTDRNRTSPFAFTGNRFEFRMPGSSVNVSCANFILNTAVAESLRLFADELEKADAGRVEEAAKELIRRELTEHKRIIFNGNGYEDLWVEEAEKRGLMNFASTPDAYRHYDDEKNIRLMEVNGVLSAEEIRSRKSIGLTEYVQLMNIEIKTMLEMIDKQIIPAVIGYAGKLAGGINQRKAAGFTAEKETELLGRIEEEYETLSKYRDLMEEAFNAEPGGMQEAGDYIYETIKPYMNECRKAADRLETMTDKKDWPFPDYTDILFYV